MQDGIEANVSLIGRERNREMFPFFCTYVIR